MLKGCKQSTADSTALRSLFDSLMSYKTSEDTPGASLVYFFPKDSLSAGKVASADQLKAILWYLQAAEAQPPRHMCQVRSDTLNIFVSESCAKYRTHISPALPTYFSSIFLFERPSNCCQVRETILISLRLPKFWKRKEKRKKDGRQRSHSSPAKANSENSKCHAQE